MLHQHHRTAIHRQVFSASLFLIGVCACFATETPAGQSLTAQKSALPNQPASQESLATLLRNAREMQIHGDLKGAIDTARQALLERRLENLGSSRSASEPNPSARWQGLSWTERSILTEKSHFEKFMNTLIPGSIPKKQMSETAELLAAFSPKEGKESEPDRKE